MPQPHNFDPTQLAGHRECPVCGLPMFLSLIEPTDQAGQDDRTFECPNCAFVETVSVKYK